MKNFCLLLTVIICLSFSSLFAQQEKVVRAKIFLDGKTMTDLSHADIPVDHGELKVGQFFVSEYTASEIEQVKAAGFRVEILIEDLLADFLARNEEAKRNLSAPSQACNNAASLYEVDHFNLGSMGGFFTYQEILANLDSMHAEYPDLISEREPIGTFKTFGNLSIYWLRISNNPTVDENKPELLFDAVHHAREAITVSQTIYFMWYLLENYNSDPLVKTILDNLELYFVPIVNPDGYLYNQSTNPNGGGFWRKNRRINDSTTVGVDLNRNYEVGWGGSGSSASPSSNTYRGTAPFSEPEAAAMKYLAEQHEFELNLSYHSFSNLLLHPWGYTFDPCPDEQLYLDMKSYLTQENGYANIAASDLYIASGIATDWMYGEQMTKNKILSMTPEVGGSDDGFWPTMDRIIPLCMENMHTNLGLAIVLLDGVDVVDLNAPIIPRIGDFTFGVQRLGLEHRPYTVTGQIVETGEVIGPIPINALNYGEVAEDLVAYDLSNFMGNQITFELEVSTNDYSYDFTFVKQLGNLVTIFEDDENTMSSWLADGTSSWVKTNTSFFAAPNSTTDSPNGNYSSGSNNMLTMDTVIDLRNATEAFLEFYAKWDIEDGFDYVQVAAKIMGTANWTPLCGQFTSIGNNNQDIGEPLYDGLQSDWVNENMSLNPFVGNMIQLRFRLISDNFVEGDGFYFDELKVKALLTDNELPTANCISNKTVYLDQNGSGSISTADINNGSTDNDYIASLELSDSTFDCNDIGNNTVVNLLVLDGSNNSATCSSEIKVLDTIPPNLTCQNITLDIAINETLDISDDDVIAVLTDNCSVGSVQLSQSSFTANNVGDNMVVVTASDLEAANMASCTAIVSINILTGIVDEFYELTAELYPNPLIQQTVLKLSAKVDLEYDVLLSDVKGSALRKYINQRSNEMTIEKGELTAGIYFVSILESGSQTILATYQLVVK